MTDIERNAGTPAAKDPAELDAAQLDQAAGGLPAVQAPAPTHELGIGSQSSGAGAGKITFNPFSITG